MTTLFSAVVLLVVGAIAHVLWVFVGNLAGLPGGLVAGLSLPRSHKRYAVGSIIAFLGQAYVGLAYAAWVAAWTRLASGRADVSGLVIWPIAFVAVSGPMWTTLVRARAEAREDHTPRNPQIEALHFTVVIVILGFVLFSAFPSLAARAWSWVPLVAAAARAA